MKTARASRGLEVPQEWYEIPVFYFSNPAAIYGPGDEVPRPADTDELDYELEVAAIVGANGQIGGFTIMNDWSAQVPQRCRVRDGGGLRQRDLRRRGMHGERVLERGSRRRRD